MAVWPGNGYHAYPTVCNAPNGAYGGHSGYGYPLPSDYVSMVIESPAPVIVPAPRTTDTKPRSDSVKPTVPSTPKGEETPAPKAKENAAPKRKSLLDDDTQSRAKIRLEIPQGAKLFVDGKLIANEKAVRTFRTPALEQGEVYFYDIRIELARDGQNLVETQRILVTAGQEVAANFNFMAEGTAVARR